MNSNATGKISRSTKAAEFDGLLFRPRSDAPIWQQIYDVVLSRIDDGRLRPGSQLPGEIHLAEVFQVTRITLRRALLQLQQEGHLTSRKGVGIFVRNRPSALSVRDGNRFFESLRADGKTVETRTLELVRNMADALVSAELRVPAGTPVIRLHRVRSADGQPIYASTKTFPSEPFPDFEAVYERRQSVTDVFVAHGIGKYRRMETRISGGFATADEASQLALTPGTPVFRTSSLNGDAVGDPVEWSAGCWLLTSVSFVF